MTTMQKLALSPPRRRKVSNDGRTVTIDWEVGVVEPENEYDRPKRAIAVLNVTHNKAGVNYFAGTRHAAHYSASIQRCCEEDVPNHDRSGTCVIVSLKIAPGYSKGILSLPGPRFNRNTLAKFADTALVRLRALVDEGDEDVLRFFEVWA